MEKTPFIGLTVLGPEDSLNADNSAFVTRDRYAIDAGLMIGIKTHRHDGSTGLSNPAIAPSGLVIGSGGSIPAGISITLGYTLQDASGGETLISPTQVVTTPSPISVPWAAPTALASYLAGSLDVDTFTYALTWTDDDGGETPVGPSVTVAREPGFASGQVELSGLTSGMEAAGATGWRLYRARAGGEYMRLAEGSGATLVDDGTLVANCDLHPPTFNTNTTGGGNQLQFFIPASFGAGTGSAQTINLYASQAGDFAESSLLLQVPIGSAGAAPVFSSLELLDAQPPDVNRSYGGANKIDPDTELLDWHWKRPVSGSAALGSGAVGDTRLVTDSGQLFAVVGSAAASGPSGWTAVGSAFAARPTQKVAGSGLALTTEYQAVSGCEVTVAEAGVYEVTALADVLCEATGGDALLRVLTGAEPSTESVFTPAAAKARVPVTQSTFTARIAKGTVIKMQLKKTGGTFVAQTANSKLLVKRVE